MKPEQKRRVIVMIPARYGASRFPGKPLAPIAGKPMIRRVYECAARAGRITDVRIATDDERIREAVEGFGGAVVMTGADNRTGSDRVADAAARMGLAPDDILVNVQGDQPVLDPHCLDQVVEPLLENPAPEMSTLAVRIDRPERIGDPNDVKVVFDASGTALYFSRSPIPFGRDPETVFDTYKHLGIYAYTREFLERFRTLPTGRLEAVEKLEQLRALEHGCRIRVVVTDRDSPSVDVPADIARIEAFLKQQGQG